MSNLQTWVNALACPTRSQMIEIARALLPRGRAWQNHEELANARDPGGFNRLVFNPDAFNVDQPPSVLWQFWASVAEFFTFAAQRACALRLEFWCATETETNDLWMEEYGLPDACDPFPDLCAKVAAIGGTRCEYYAMIAARAGWAIACEINTCGARAGSGRAKAGCCSAGKTRSAAILHVFVDLDSSTSFHGNIISKRALAGHFRAGRRLSCIRDFFSLTDVTGLDCLLARVVHAEITIKYEAIVHG